MPRATLILDADVAPLRRAMGEIPGYTRRAQSAATAEERRGGAERARADANFAKLRDSIHLQLARAREKREREETNKSRAERQKRVRDDAAFASLHDGIHRQLARAREQRERQQTAKDAAEGRRRVQADAAFAPGRDGIHRRLVVARERRERDARQRLTVVGGRVGEAVGAVIGGGVTYGSAMHGQIQSARQRRAPAQRATGLALYQAGGDSAERNAAFSEITRFAAANGMESGELANALNAAQTEFSVLGNNEPGNTAARRGAALGNFLQTARLARDTGNDVGEFTRLQGLFADTRIDPATQRQLLLYAAGAAQRGSIEVGSVTREAMGSIRTRIGQAIAGAPQRGQSPAQAAADAFRQSLAELEVARSAGETPRAAGAAVASLNTALQGDRTQETLLGNLDHYRQHGTRAQRGTYAALRNQLFEADPERRGRMRLRSEYQDSLRLYEAFGAAGLSGADTMNLTRGTGAGNPLSLLSNQRRVLGELLNPDASGRRGTDRVRDIMSTATLTQADVDRGAALFGSDELSALTRAQEQGDNALTDNTKAVIGLSSRFADWSASHPFEAQGVETGMSVGKTVAETAVGGNLLRAAGQRLAATPAGRALLSRFLPAVVPGAAAGGAGLSLGAVGGGLLRAMSGAPGLLGTLLMMGGAWGGAEQLDPAQGEGDRQRRGAEEWDRQAGRLAAEHRAQNQAPPTAEEIGAAVAEALRNNPPTATVTPAAAAHASANGASSRPSRT